MAAEGQSKMADSARKLTMEVRNLTTVAGFLVMSVSELKSIV